jgi:hypothetical protein
VDEAALDRDLERMAGDPRIARAVKDSLRQLTDGSAGRELAEMARDLLEGRTDLPSVAGSTAYSEHLGAAVSTYERWYRGLTPEQRQHLYADTTEYLANRDWPSK